MRLSERQPHEAKQRHSVCMHLRKLLLSWRDGKDLSTSWGPLQFPRLMVSQRVDHVSLPQPDWGAASSDYVGPSNGNLLLPRI